MSGVIIIGNGIAGVTCARHIRKHSNIPITIISNETEHFFARTALMYIYMGHMKYEHTKPYEDNFWAKNNLKLVKGYVSKIDTEKKELIIENESALQYDTLVISSGSSSNYPGLPGEKLTGVQGLYSYPDLLKIEQLTKGIKTAVIVGGGLIGIELAEMLFSRNIHVTLIVKDKSYWGNVLAQAEGDMIGRHIAEHHINLLLQEELEAIVGNEGKVTSVVTKSGKTIPAEFVGLAIGVHPNISFLDGSNIQTDKGILVDEYFQTNMPCVYALGDCVQYRNPLKGRKPVEQVWYTGKIHGETLAQTLTGNKTSYQPGPWFNSAKFLDIEYQVYGNVPANEEEKLSSFVWQHPTEHILFRLVLERQTQIISGIQVLGIRLRHEIVNRWLLQKASADEVMTQLRNANFDPEFYSKYEQSIIEKYNSTFSKNVTLTKKSWTKIFQSRKVS